MMRVKRDSSVLMGAAGGVGNPGALLHAQGARRMALSLQDAQRAWEELPNGRRGTILGPPVGSPVVTTAQHTMHTPAGSYIFRVTEFLPPSSSDAPPLGKEQAASAGAATPDLAKQPAASGGPGVGAASPGLLKDGDMAGRPRVAFLHGFLGAGEDWAAVAGALALSCRCFAIDLPGHGGSRALSGTGAGRVSYPHWLGCAPESVLLTAAPAHAAWRVLQVLIYSLLARQGAVRVSLVHGCAVGQVCCSAGAEGAYGVEAMADAVAALLEQLSGQAQPWHVVGYSLGARIALRLAARHGARACMVTWVADLVIYITMAVRAACSYNQQQHCTS